MNKAKVALITFGDHRDDMWEKVFASLTEARHRIAHDILEALPVELLSFKSVQRSREQINKAVDEMKALGAEVLIAHVPAWTSPNLVVHGIQRMGLYTIVLGNRDPATHGTVGLLGASGTLAQIGFPFENLRCDYDVDQYKERLLPSLLAASAKERLKGSVFGLFGGRSIGIDTAVFDPMQWRSLFGIDTEHVDQLEIVRRAALIEPERVAILRKWLESNGAVVNYNDAKFTPEKFDFQCACYLAFKDMTTEYGMEFTAIKCMPELSTHYVPQCMTQMLLACAEDAEGPKPTTPIACEADADGALTQQILRLITGGSPTFFADVSHIDDVNSTIYCVNCGAICAYYAGRSSSMVENLGKIEFRQSVRPGGGGISCFTAAPGPVQLARLYRRNGAYHMAIIPAQAEQPSEEALAEFVKARGAHQLPTLFAKVSCNLDRFVSEYGSNHISGVEGHHVAALEAFCRQANIVPEVFA
jgi:L-fucose isomerase